MKTVTVNHPNDEDDPEVSLRAYADLVQSQEDNGPTHINGSAKERLENSLTSQYWYPPIRFSTVFRVISFLDATVTIVLWLTGGNSHYFLHNITSYNFLTSVFDEAVLSLLKFPLYVILVYNLEQVAIRKLDLPPDNTVLWKRERLLIATLILASFSVLVFSLVKGGLILYRVVNDDNYEGMHRTYYACVIWCIVLALITLLLSVASKFLLRSLERNRKLKYYNREGKEVDENGKPLPRTVNLFRLLTLAKPEAGLLAWGMLFLLLSTAVAAIAPLFFGRVVDAALESMDKLNKTVFVLVVIYLAGAVSNMIRSFLFNLAGQRLVARLRKTLFKSVIVQDVAFFDVNRTGELCNRLASDTSILQNALTINVSMLVRYILQIFGSLILMFYLNASLTGVLLAVVPVVTLGGAQYGKFVRKMRKQFQDRLGDAGTEAEENLSSVRTVKSFTGEEKAANAYGKSIDESYEIGKKLSIATGAMDGLFTFLAYGAIAAVLWYGGKLVYDNSQDPGTGISSGLLTSFLLYTLQVAMGFVFLSSLYGDFMQAVGASTRIFTLLDRKPDIFTPNHPLVLPSLTGDIEFRNVKFTYPSRPETEVLKGVTFSVEKGQMVALVGPSGGGKSTIVSLIERFYDPNDGAIMMDGCDLKFLDIKWLRNKISMVSQEPTLFACSIRDNIAYGTEATDEEVEAAARQANAHDFIMAFEDGYKTLVGERGVRLSGGQKQRVAIARALIMDPILLLLDEATSALDAESEHLVQEAIDRAMQGRTVIVIAHRLSTVRNAHKVVVIDKGCIAEMGTHSELLAKHGVYKRLVIRQLTAGAPTVDGPTGSDGSQVDAERHHVNRGINNSNSGYINGGLDLELDDGSDSEDSGKGEDNKRLIDLD